MVSLPIPIVPRVKQPVPLVAIARRIDRALTTVESSQINLWQGALLQSITQLEKEIYRLWPDSAEIKSKSAAWRYARSRLVLAELRGVLEGLTSLKPGDPKQQAELASGEFTRGLEKVYSFGVNEAVDLLEHYSPGMSRQLADTAISPNYAALSLLGKAMTSRLENYSATAVQTIKDQIAFGLLTGDPPRKVVKAIKERVWVDATANIERLVRTEFHIILDEALQNSYKTVGIEYVQRIAVMDSRTCPYCAERSGNVYRIGEAPATLHPNDRCYMLPWSPEWVDEGVIDEDWVKNHHKETVERIKAEGKEPNPGIAPMERWREMKEPPTPVWTPTTFFTGEVPGLGIDPGLQERLFPSFNQPPPGVDPLTIAPPPATVISDRQSYERYMHETLGIPQVDGGGIATARYDQLAHHFRELARRFPSAFRHMQAVTTYDRVNPHNMGFYDVGEVAHVHFPADARGKYVVMALNPLDFGTTARNLDDMAKVNSPDWMVGRTMTDVVTHEFGHVIERYIMEKASQDVWGLRHQIVTDEKWRQPTLSVYGNSEPAERWAEAFAAIMGAVPESRWTPDIRLFDYYFREIAAKEGWSMEPLSPTEFVEDYELRRPHTAGGSDEWTEDDLLYYLGEQWEKLKTQDAMRRIEEAEAEKKRLEAERKQREATEAVKKINERIREVTAKEKET